MRNSPRQSKAVYKKKLFLIIGRPNHIFYNKIFNTSLALLIILNVLAVILDTVPSIYNRYHWLFHSFEIFSSLAFSIEYLARVWSCDFEQKYKGGIKGKLKFISSPMAIVDLLSILPSILPIFFSLDLRVLRAVRLFRLIRLLKLARYSLAMRTLVRVIKNKGPELTISLSFGMILLMIASCLMYFVEHDAQPEAFSSIPATMWWAAATLTTVGYGDIYPITTLGKVLGAGIAILGVAMFALPAGIIASELPNVIHGPLDQQKTCTFCGQTKAQSLKNEKVA